jgi:hypothetical protein
VVGCWGSAAREAGVHFSCRACRDGGERQPGCLSGEIIIFVDLPRKMEIEARCECQACGKVRVLEAGPAAGGRFRPTCPLTQPAWREI